MGDCVAMEDWNLQEMTSSHRLNFSRLDNNQEDVSMGLPKLRFFMK